MLKSLQIFLLLCCLPIICSAKEAGVIKVALYALKPFMSSTRDRPSGLIGDVIYQQFAQIKGYTIKYDFYPFARVMNLIERGDADVAVMIAKTPEREVKFLYSNDQLWVSRPAIVVKTTSPLRHIKDVKELDGKVLGHAISSIIPAELSPLKITWQFRGEGDYFKNALRSVSIGRLDAFFAPTYTFAKYMLDELHETTNYALVKLPVNGLPLYAIYPKSADPKKVNVLNQAIHKTSLILGEQNK